MIEGVTYVWVIAGSVFIIGLLAFIVKMYKKASQGESLVRTGMGGTKVSFSGMFVLPIVHMLEKMDITVKTIVIAREGKDGLVCKDNLRADIKVTFFVRVNKTVESVKKVAESIGCKRASDQRALEQLFDAKFSEALKTVGKHFEFTELYNSRAQFNERIVQEIGRNLNGYVLEDCAIDYLEQTPMSLLDEMNILDAEGIKKITEMTAQEKIHANLIQRDKEKTIKKQDVEARETILELERQQIEKEEKQRREIAITKAREQAQIDQIREEEEQRSELARIRKEEELEIQEANKQRQILVAVKNKEKTEAIETERVDKERLLELTEKERIIELARIEKDKSVEEEKKNIQEVIRQRVILEKSVVEEKEKIKDTEEFAAAERKRKVAITAAEERAEEHMIKETKAAESLKKAAEFSAQQKLIDADAELNASNKKSDAIKIMAQATTAEHAAVGLAEAQVIEARSLAMKKQGESEAYSIEQKAAAMKKLDGVGREHEEFKLTLNKEKEIDLAQINIQRDIATAQASVISEALKSAKIDIVGGESTFFNQITEAITKGKKIDRTMDNSETLTLVRDTFFQTEEGESFRDRFKQFLSQFGIDSTDDIKNLSVASFLTNLKDNHDGKEKQSQIAGMLNVVNVLGFADKSLEDLGLS